MLDSLSAKYDLTGEELLILTDEHEMLKKLDTMMGKWAWEPDRLNTGVMFLKYDKLSLELLKVWMEARSRTCIDKTNQHAWEQSCLARLMFDTNGFEPEILNRIKLL